jgi:chromosome segregation protein
VEQARRASEDLEVRVASATEELGLLLQADAGEPAAAESAQPAGENRIAALEAQLAELEGERQRELASALGDLQGERRHAAEELERCRGALAGATGERERLDAQADRERGELRESERELDAARRAAAEVGAELAAVNQFLRSHASPARATRAAGDGPRSLSEALRVRPGYELALAAVLGERLDAALASDLASAQQLLDGAGPDGAAALLAGSDGRSPETPENGAGSAPAADGPDGPPVDGAEPLAALLSASPAIAELAGRLLRGAWVVERLEDLPADFAGIAVTRSGRVWFGQWGEVRQVNEGGSERVLAQRNERERLIADSERAASREHAAHARADRLREALFAGEPVREQAERAVRERERELAEAAEALRRADWLIEQRRIAPEAGPLAVRRAELQGELAAERRQAERAARERDRRLERIRQLRARQAADAQLLPRVPRLLNALRGLAEAVAVRAAELDERLASDRAAGEEMSAELRECASLEADLQIRLRAEGESVTSAEVAAQRLRDLLAESELELRSLTARLQLDLASLAPAEPLAEEEADQLRERLQRLERRRQQLGPVNPLAQEEYAEALAHVAELESRRGDLETALRELQTLIRDADRQIEEVFEETFAAAARNFDELVGDLFPGGSGRLRLVDEGLSRRAVLGGQAAPAEEDPDEPEGEPERELEEAPPGEEERGVEIELTPAGKSTKRLSLLSGGEKAMTALAFLFSVILARPCPFYILDEVEAALDDHNLGRFLVLLRRHAGRAQFIVITHQQRTMEAADWLYGVSMGGDGVSKVLSRRLPAPPEPTGAAAAA